MAKRKRQPAAAASPPPGSGQTADQIIKCLEQASSLTGQRPHRVFDNWLQLVEVTLEMLPAHLRAIARTGQLAPDSPEAAATFARLRGEQRSRDRAAVSALFGHYARAFGYLLDGTAPGLWSPTAAEGYLGPDILGQTYMRYANTDPRWQAQYFTPWAVALTLAKLTVPNGPVEVHARLNVTGSIICPKRHDMLLVWPRQNMLPVICMAYKSQQIHNRVALQLCFRIDQVIQRHIQGSGHCCQNLGAAFALPRLKLR